MLYRYSGPPPSAGEIWRKHASSIVALSFQLNPPSVVHEYSLAGRHTTNVITLRGAPPHARKSDRLYATGLKSGAAVLSADSYSGGPTYGGDAPRSSGATRFQAPAHLHEAVAPPTFAAPSLAFSSSSSVSTSSSFALFGGAVTAAVHHDSASKRPAAAAAPVPPSTSSSSGHISNTTASSITNTTASCYGESEPRSLKRPRDSDFVPDNDSEIIVIDDDSEIIVDDGEDDGFAAPAPPAAVLAKKPEAMSSYSASDFDDDELFTLPSTSKSSFGSHTISAFDAAPASTVALPKRASKSDASFSSPSSTGAPTSLSRGRGAAGKTSIPASAAAVFTPSSLLHPAESHPLLDPSSTSFDTTEWVHAAKSTGRGWHFMASTVASSESSGGGSRGSPSLQSTPLRLSSTPSSSAAAAAVAFAPSTETNSPLIRSYPAAPSVIATLRSLSNAMHNAGESQYSLRLFLRSLGAGVSVLTLAFVGSYTNPAQLVACVVGVARGAAAASQSIGAAAAGAGAGVSPTGESAVPSGMFVLPLVATPLLGAAQSRGANSGSGSRFTGGSSSSPSSSLSASNSMSPADVAAAAWRADELLSQPGGEHSSINGSDPRATLPTRTERWQALHAILCLPAMRKVIYNAKSILHALERCPLMADCNQQRSARGGSAEAAGAALCGIWDPLIAAYLLSPDAVAKGDYSPPLSSGGGGASYRPPSSSASSSSPSSASAAIASSTASDDSGAPCSLASLAAAHGVNSSQLLRGPGGGAPAPASHALVTHVHVLAATADALARQLRAAGLMAVFEMQEMPLVRVLAGVEARGFSFQGAAYKDALELCNTRIRTLESEAAAAAGTPFNLASPQQVSEVLYGRLGMHAPEILETGAQKRKGEKKHPSCNEKALTILSSQYSHPVLSLIMEFRKVNKLLTGFLTPLRACAQRVGSSPAASSSASSSSAASLTLLLLTAHTSSPARGAVASLQPLLRIHTQLQQTRTGTGRLSSTDPNLQNLPRGPSTAAAAASSSSSSSSSKAAAAAASSSSAAVTAFLRQQQQQQQDQTEVIVIDDDDDEDDGQGCTNLINIRSAFVPSCPGRVILSLDYSQIEVRILAHMSQDRVLQQALGPQPQQRSSSGGPSSPPLPPPPHDLYKALAASVFRCESAVVTDAQRQQAKTALLSQMYGAGPSEVANKLKIGEGEASGLMGKISRTFPMLPLFQQRVVSFATQNGYVPTLSGRRRLLPDLRSSNFGAVGHAQRAAVNTVIQGSAADVIKVAMLLVQAHLSTRRCSSSSSRSSNGDGSSGRTGGLLLLQIHDELIVECEADDASVLGAELADIMRHDVPVQLEKIARAGPFVAFSAHAAATASSSSSSASLRPSNYSGAGGGGGASSSARDSAVMAILGGAPRLAVPLAVTTKVGQSWGSLGSVRA